MYDVVIVGLGCAGYTAMVYTARYKLSTLIVGEVEGGMGMTAAEVGNWPGIIDIKGPDLMENYRKHALSYPGTEHRNGKVEKIAKMKEGFVLELEGGEKIQARTVIIATGSDKRKLGAKGEQEYSGKGLTYCATCDAYFFKGKTVAVVGGGDSAVEGAAITAQVCKKVYLIHRRNQFRAEPYWVDRVKGRDNVEFVLERNVVEILGDGKKVTGVMLDKSWTDPRHPEQARTRDGFDELTMTRGAGRVEGHDVISVDGVFIEVGSNPASLMAKDAGCALDEKGFIKVGADQATTVPGVFAAGDCTTASNYFAQFTTAAGEASVAANSAFTYLGKLEAPKNANEKFEASRGYGG